MKYIRETNRRDGRVEITRVEAAAAIGANALEEIEEQVGRYAQEFPGIAVMVEVKGVGDYVGAQA